MHPIRYREAPGFRFNFRDPVPLVIFMRGLEHMMWGSGREPREKRFRTPMILQNLKSQWSENAGDEMAEKCLGEPRVTVCRHIRQTQKSQRIICQGKNSLSLHFFSSLFSREKIIPKCLDIFYCITEVCYL